MTAQSVFSHHAALVSLKTGKNSVELRLLLLVLLDWHGEFALLAIGQQAGSKVFNLTLVVLEAGHEGLHLARVRLLVHVLHQFVFSLNSTKRNLADFLRVE